MGGVRLARIGERDVLEGQAFGAAVVRCRFGGDRLVDEGAGVENPENGLGRRLAEHAGVKLCPHVAQGAEELDPHHQHDEKSGKLHETGLDAPGAVAECCRRGDGNRGIGDAASQ